MKNRKKIMLATAIALLILALAAISSAQAAAAKTQLQLQIAQQRASFGLNPYLRGLGLSQAQKDQVQAILVKYKSEIQTLVRDSALARLELNKTIAGGARQNSLDSAFSRTMLAEQNVIRLKATIALEIRNILTEDQLSKLDLNIQTAGTRLQKPPKPPAK